MKSLNWLAVSAVSLAGTVASFLLVVGSAEGIVADLHRLLVVEPNREAALLQEYQTVHACEEAKHEIVRALIVGQLDMAEAAERFLSLIADVKRLNGPVDRSWACQCLLERVRHYLHLGPHEKADIIARLKRQYLRLILVATAW